MGGMVYCFQSAEVYLACCWLVITLVLEHCGKMFWSVLFCRTGENVLWRTWLLRCLCRKVMASETQRWFLWLQEAGWTWSDPLTQPTTCPPESAKLAVRISTGRASLPVKVLPRYQVCFKPVLYLHLTPHTYTGSHLSMIPFRAGWTNQQTSSCFVWVFDAISD